MQRKTAKALNKYYGKSKTPMSASYVSILLSPVLFGLLAQNLSIGLFPVCLLALFLIAFVFTERLRRETDQKGSHNS